MNKNEYQKTKTQLEKDNPTPLNETNKDGIPKFAQRNEDIQIPKNKEFTPIKGQTEQNKEKSKQLIERYKDKIPMHNTKNNNTYTGKNIQELITPNTEELPDITEFLQSEEYLRNGIKTRIPIPITLNGQDYKIYIRSLSSNEYYKLQLRQVREKKSLNYLAAITVCEDGNGNRIPQEFFDELGFEITERIGEAISIASGSDGQDDRVASVVEKYLTG